MKNCNIVIRCAIALFMIAFGTSLYAQDKTAIELSATSAAAIVGDTMRINISIGGIMGASSYVDIKDGINVTSGDVTLGMPPFITYFPAVFGSDLFASKAYYPDYVLLSWDVISQADNITRFKIFRKPLELANADSTLVATLNGGETNYRDEFIQFGVIYKYTVYAEGIADGILIPFVNYIEGIGFALPEGTVSGRVTFKGGTAVSDVTVIAETDGELQGQSLFLNGTDANLVVPHRDSHNELNIETGFTIQMWIKSSSTGTKQLFSKGTDYQLTYDQTNLNFQVGNASLTLPFINPIDSFFQVTASYDPVGDSLNLYATITSDTIFSIKGNAGSTPASNTESMVFGGSQASDFFNGYVDEIRLWDKILKLNEIKIDANRFIPTDQDNLISYWRIQVGIGEGFYDATQNLAGFNENHGILNNTSWSNITPLRSQLAYKGITDTNGNYIIEGIPYESSGSTYRFIPIFGVHEFNPNEQLRIMGPSAAVHNGIDFEDVSSFAVTGTIRYFNTTFPVEGVSILIDGQPSLDVDGGLITTDNNGQFSVDVPIGNHTLKMSKTSHTFVDNGRFNFDFFDPLNGLEFVDSTLVRVVGRVVGGPVEEAFPIGFGRSTNNIGNATIVFESQSPKGNLVIFNGATVKLGTGESFINPANSRDETRTENHFSSINSFKGKQLTVSADVSSGDFIAMLPPEKYNIISVTATGSTNPPGAGDVLDIRNFIGKEEVVADTVRKQVDGADILGIFNASEYSAYTLEESITGDTTFTVAIDTFIYHNQQDFILRTTPTIIVTDDDRGDLLFGNDEFEYVDENLPVNNATVPLISTGSYTFNHPVFKQRTKYDFKIKLFENYTNQATSTATQVPVVDGELRITNELAINSNEISIELDDKGEAIYSFTAGLPNRNLDAGTPANSFTRVLNITALSGNKGAIQTPWSPNGSAFRGIVFGGEPIGNNFVTTGPTEVITILRDPPGSNSFASLTKGESISRTTTLGSGSTFTDEKNFKLQFGTDITIFAGIGVGTITEIEIENSLDIGYTAEETVTSEFESSTTYTTTQTWSTSKSPDFVGSDGDVFVGHATNLVYGKSLFLEPLLATDCTTPCSNIEVSGFKLGVKEGLRINPEFSTGFIFSQSHIKNTLIPNLEAIRNSFLVTGVDPNTINPTTNPVYVSLIASDDSKFGSNNNDETVWGTSAITSSSQWGNGPSYVIRTPDPNVYVSDTVFYYNREIAGWEFWLEENERQKVEATLKENISFDGGVSFENSTENTASTSKTRTFEFMVNNSVGLSFGVTVDNFGFNTSLSSSYSKNNSNGSNTTTETTTNYAYSLNDGDAGDSYTVDVKTPKDGFGPVFSVKGGVSSCPYQEQELTSYFEPGSHVLHEATVNVEDPGISFENNRISNVPDNREAEFTLILVNNSQNDSDALFDLKVDNSTNPDGAVISVDGAPIGNGRTFTVESGVNLSLTMKVAKGLESVFDYDNIRLTLASRCEPETFSDEATFSVSYQPSCTDIAISSPTENWVINSNTNPANVLPIVIGAYDLNNATFNNIKYQYRGLGTALWITDRTFYAIESDYNTAVTNDKGNESEWINARSQITYNWDMTSIPDREYELRALAVCVLGPGSEILTPTDAILGIKDTKRPQLFGSPQPADGILSSSDEISIQFDEPIVAASLTPFNFSITGVLNGSELTNGTSVDFDGANDFLRIQNANSISASFTVEFWVQRDVLATEGVIFSKGNLDSNRLQIGFDATDKMTVEFSGQVITSTALPVNDTEWHHYGISYDASIKKIYAYQDGEFIIDLADVTGSYTGEGPIYLGKTVAGTGTNFDGAVHEFRVWNVYQQQGQIAAKRFISLKGTEVNLIGYWPFDEGRGNLSIDLSRSNQAELFAGWRIQPQGYAVKFNGSTDYLEISTGTTVIVQDVNDYTVEFWFKGISGQGASTLFSSGRGDGTDDANFNDPNKSLSIGFNSNGDLFANSNEQTLLVADGESNYLDDNWHHLALVLKRKGNISFIVDGELLSNKSANNFGGIIGTNMWIGVRGTKISTLTKSFDQYFNGRMDEIRIWKLARTIDQINVDRNKHIGGDELGLLAYYPFEQYTLNNTALELTNTFDDQLINIQIDGSNLTGGTATTMGSTLLDMETANIGLPRPVSKVDFTWVVNGDKIIITPNPTQADLIENVILDITVANVEDNRGNVLASPATWRAFVDRNSMKWDEKNLDLTKKFQESLSFDVDIINRGGTNESFSISNIPPWMTVSPSTGSIEPASTLTVTFTVSEELNIGEFTSDIRLITDFGFDEILLFKLKVNIDPPSNWVVNSSDYEYSMNVIGQVNVEGVLSNDVADILAVFVNDTIRGLTNLEFISSFDNYQAFLTVYSNNPKGETLDFRIWDASAGTIRGKVTPSNLIFNANTTEGLPSAPILFEANDNVYQEVDVVKGWQWLSFNLSSADLNNTKLLLNGLIATDGDQIKGKNGFDDYTSANGWTGSLGILESGIMYKLYTDKTGDLSYEGNIIEPSTKSLNIVSGWNWIGFVPRVNMSINEALGGLTAASGDIIKSQLQFAIYEQNIGWIGSLKTLRPGAGFMLKSTNAGTLVFPNEGLINGRTSYESDEVTVEEWPYNPALFADNMTLIAALDLGINTPNDNNYRLGAFVDDKLRGIAEPIFDANSQSNKYFMSIGGDVSSDVISFKAIDTEGSIIDVIESISFESNSLIGSLDKPLSLTFDISTLETKGVTVYPNPFDQTVRISGHLKEAGKLSVVIYDMAGKMIKNLYSQNKDAGNWELNWNGTGKSGTYLKTGLYIIKVKTNIEVYNIKVIKD